MLFNTNTVQSFTTSLQDIHVRGHQLALIFTNNFIIKIMFALHGQLVPMSPTIFQQILSSSYQFPVTWQLAITLDAPISSHPSSVSPVVFLFADYNKLAQYHLLKLSSSSCSIWSSDRNCDPRDNWEEYVATIQLNFFKFRKPSSHSIIDTITSSHLFNGFGLNHATEALHYAHLHPFQSTAMIFQSAALRSRLLEGLHHVATCPSDWSKYIPRKTDLNNPFHFNESAWKYYYSRVNKVYQKTGVFVSIQEYETLVNANLVDASHRRSSSSSRVQLPVYKVWKESKRTKRKVGHFSYTCITALPVIAGSDFIYQRYKPFPFP